MPIDITPVSDDLGTLKLDVGDTYIGVIVDIDEAPHYKFGTQEPEYQRDGKAKTKWVVRLRDPKATTADDDVKFWTQNQVKFALREELAKHPQNYLGGLLKIVRNPDGEPKQKGYKGPADYSFTLKAGPDGWTDPLAPAEAFDPFGEDEEPFVVDAGDWWPQAEVGAHPERMLP